MVRMNGPARERVHFIGIGGIGMSGIARMYLTRGHAVQGSDLSPSELLNDLEKMGARVMIGHDAGHVDGASVVVYSSSIPADHPERAAAVKKGIRVIHRADALAALCLDKFTIAVTGTHGKTTTTAMTGLIFKEAGHDPSVVVGGVVDVLGGNARTGRGEEMVIEADESDASFLKFSPDVEIITNIEKEHLDHYGTVENMEQAYRDFIGRLRPGGHWIGCGEDPCVRRLASEKLKPCLLYGFDPAFDFYATDVIECPDGEIGVVFKVWRDGKCLGPVRLNVPGRHNALNALAAIAAATLRNVEFTQVRAALSKFGGAGRRFDVRYESPDLMIVDDYAHHPTEIRKTLSAAKALGRKRIFAVFQPHRYSRTASMLEDFAGAFTDADKLFITDIYAAGERPLAGVTAEKVCEAVRASGHADVRYAPKAEIAGLVRAEMRPGDLVIVLGAGDVYKVAKELSFFRGLRGKVLREEPLSRHTSLKIGGPAEYWLEPEDLEDLKSALWECRQRQMKARVIGAGSNVLAADEGVRGVVIYLGSPYFREIKMAGNKVLARAGVVNTLFIQFGLEHGLGGFEFLSGIPGNIGGAVAMNAGSHGESADKYLDEAVLLGFDGRLRRVKKEEIDFRYRYSGIQNEIVVEAVFSFPKAPAEAVMKKLEEYREHRAKTQDLSHASAGCLFKNPEMAGCSSGKLIDDAGLKGFSVGKAGVSEKHANFMINLGGATAKDVRELIVRVREAVKRRSGVELETEVRWFADPPRRAAGRIAVLAGGPSAEREVSLVSGQAVHDALKEKGFDVRLVDPDPARNFIGVMKNENVSLVFNAVHGTFGEDGKLQRMLEEAGIDYTGDGPEVSELAFDKALSQEAFAREGILVPENRVLRDPQEAKRALPARFPVVVKPCKSGSSVGVTIVRNKEDFPEACAEAFRHSDAVLVEEYVAGRELTVGFLGDQALPIVEVIPKDQFYDYRAKYQSSDTRYEFPARLTPEEASAVESAARRAYEALGCEVMGRVDVILAGRDAYVLEINTIPGLTGKSLLPKAAAASGIEFGDLCVRIMELSQQRVSAK